VGAGLAYGLFARFVFSGDAPGDGVTGLFLTMSAAFVFLVPLAIGWMTVYFAPRERWRDRKVALGMPWLMTLASLVAVYVTGFEGMICIVMMLPIFLIMSYLGAAMGRRALETALRSGRLRAGALAAVLLLPYLVAPVESAVPLAYQERVVENRVRIRADAASVWANIVRVPPIAPEEYGTSFVHRIGFPRPVEATLSREGVGGVRHASFERGVVFIETVTHWEPERLLSFTIHADPSAIPPTALDPHVTVGGPYFDVLDGTYRIEPAGPGEVVLTLSSTHRLATHFNVYASFWSDLVMRQVQRNILEVVKRRAEAVS
jgi:hypothetical protein